MKSGRLRFRVQIESYGETQDSAGQPIKAWVPFAERKASIDPIDPLRNPLFRADERFEPEMYQIGVRFVPGLMPTMRVVEQETAKIYEIINVAPDKKTHRREQVLICRTGINDNG